MLLLCFVQRGPGYRLEPGRSGAAPELRERQPHPVLEPQHRRGNASPTLCDAGSSECSSPSQHLVHEGTIGPNLQVLYELPTGSQWCFDIQWCPRNPAVLSAAGFDGHIDIYSIMGGSSQAQSQRHADQVRASLLSPSQFKQ